MILSPQSPQSSPRDAGNPETSPGSGSGAGPSDAVQTTTSMITILSTVMERLTEFKPAVDKGDGGVVDLVEALGGVKCQLECELQAIASAEQSHSLHIATSADDLDNDENRINSEDDDLAYSPSSPNSPRERIKVQLPADVVALQGALEIERESNVELLYKVTELQHTLRVCATREIELESELEALTREKEMAATAGQPWSGMGVFDDDDGGGGGGGDDASVNRHAGIVDAALTPLRSTSAAIRALSASLSPAPSRNGTASGVSAVEHARLRELVALSERHATEAAQQYALLFTRCKRQLCLADGETDGLKQLVDYLRGSNAALQSEVRELKMSAAAAQVAAIMAPSPALYNNHHRHRRRRDIDDDYYQSPPESPARGEARHSSPPPPPASASVRANDARQQREWVSPTSHDDKNSAQRELARARHREQAREVAERAAEEDRRVGAQRVALYMELSALREETKAQAAALEEAQAALRRCRVDAQAKQALLDAAEAAGHTAAEQYGALVLSHTQLQREALGLEDARDRLAAELNDVGAELAERTSQLSEASRRLTTSETERANREAASEASLLDSAAALEASRKEILALSAELSHVKARGVQLAEEATDLEAQLCAREERLELAVRRSDKFEQQVAQLGADLAAAQSAEAASAAQLAALHRHHQDVQDLVQSEVSMAIASNADQLRLAQANVESLELANANLQAEVRAAQEEASRLTAAVDHAEAELEKRDEAVRELRAIMSEAENRVERGAAELKEAHSALETLRSASVQQHKQLAALEMKLVTAGEAVSEAQNVSAASSRALSDVSFQRDALAVQLHDSLENCETLRLASAGAALRIEALETSLSATVAEKLRLSASSSEFEAALCHEREAVAGLVAASRELRSQVEELDVAKGRAEASLQLQRIHTAQVERELASTQQTLTLAATANSQQRELQSQLAHTRSALAVSERAEAAAAEMVTLLVAEKDALRRAVAESTEREAVAVNERNAAVDMHERALSGAQALLLQSKEGREAAEREKEQALTLSRNELALSQAQIQRLGAALDAEADAAAAREARECDLLARIDVLEAALAERETSLSQTLQREARALATIDALAESKDGCDAALRDKISRENSLLVELERLSEQCAVRADEITVLQRARDLVAEQLETTGCEVLRMRAVESELTHRLQRQEADAERRVSALKAKVVEAQQETVLARAMLTLPLVPVLAVPVSVSASSDVAAPSAADAANTSAAPELSMPLSEASVGAEQQQQQQQQDPPMTADSLNPGQGLPRVLQDLARKLALWEEQRRPLRAVTAKLHEASIALRAKAAEVGAELPQATCAGYSYSYASVSPTRRDAASAVAPSAVATSASSPGSVAAAASADALVLELAALAADIAASLPWLRSLQLRSLAPDSPGRERAAAAVAAAAAAAAAAATAFSSMSVRAGVADGVKTGSLPLPVQVATPTPPRVTVTQRVGSGNRESSRPSASPQSHSQSQRTPPRHPTTSSSVLSSAIISVSVSDRGVNTSPMPRATTPLMPSAPPSSSRPSLASPSRRSPGPLASPEPTGRRGLGGAVSAAAAGSPSPVRTNATVHNRSPDSGARSRRASDRPREREQERDSAEKGQIRALAAQLAHAKRQISKSLATLRVLPPAPTPPPPPPPAQELRTLTYPLAAGSRPGGDTRIVQLEPPEPPPQMRPGLGTTRSGTPPPFFVRHVTSREW